MPKFPKVNGVETKAENAKARQASREPKHFEHSHDLYEVDREGELVGVNLTDEVPAPEILRCKSCGQRWRSDELSGDHSNGSLEKCPRCSIFEIMDGKGVSGEMQYLKKTSDGLLIPENETEEPVPGVYIQAGR